MQGSRRTPQPSKGGKEPTGKVGGNSTGANIINRKGGGGRGYPDSRGGDNTNDRMRAGGRDTGTRIYERGAGGSIGQTRGPLGPNSPKDGGYGSMMPGLTPSHAAGQFTVDKYGKALGTSRPAKKTIT